MALGGWIYHTMLVPSFDNTNDTLVESNIIDPMISLLSGMAGWSVSVAKTKYKTDSGWYFELGHTGGAHLAVVCIGQTTTTSTYIDASNMINVAAVNGDYGKNQVFFSYWPPGHSGAGAADPSVAGYVPSDGFSFIWGCWWATLVSGHTTRFHFMARDDDLIAVTQFDTSYVDVLTMMGSLFVPVHASDSGSRKAEGIMNRWATARAVGGRHGTCFADDNTTRIRWEDSTFIDNNSWLTSSVNNAAPWSWVPALAGRQLYPGATGLASGVTSMSGFKGPISDEWFRWTVPSGGPGTKQQLASGNLIHVAEGVVVGWDSGNGAMS